MPIPEPRTGILFAGHVTTNTDEAKTIVTLLITGQNEPVATIEFHTYEATHPEGFVDLAFQRWIRSGGFRETVKDQAILHTLDLAQRERLSKTEPYERTHRFLRATDSTQATPRFILTEDKSDLIERNKRIREIGATAVPQEEAAREREVLLQSQRMKADEERLRAENADIIAALVKSALNGKRPPDAAVQQLSRLGLLQSSTRFRHCTQYPGEDSLLWYDLTEHGVRHAGFLGFDINLRLISVDERLPVSRELYLPAA